jgi:tRNA threonylcarbamoyl adenosine modification protein (Sua5/YciO/YrdC/YwlC family)
MAQLLYIHQETPQIHLLRQAVATIRRGGIIVYPTDSGYALGCQIGDKSALDKIRQLRHLEPKHNFTLVCRDLSELSTYAIVADSVYRILRAYTPGSYTFILPATREVPRRLQHPKRRTIGIRIPNNVITLALLEMLDEPLMSTTLTVPGTETALLEPEAIREVLGERVDLILAGGHCGLEPTTVVDLTGSKPVILRQGKGDPAPFL